MNSDLLLFFGNSCPVAAKNFFNATGITNPTITHAICKFVNSLQAHALWEKFHAIYPFVGGTATTHKFNLINPQDTNAAHRLSFGAGVTHSANGAQGNGTGNTNTFFNVGANNENRLGIGLYSRTNSQTASTVFSIEVPNIASNTRTNFRPQVDVGTARFRVYLLTDLPTSKVSSDSLGFFGATRISNSQVALIDKVSAQTFSSGIGPNVSSAGNVNILKCARQIALAFICGNLSAAQMLEFRNIVNQLQTDLGRAV